MRVHYLALFWLLVAFVSCDPREIPVRKYVDSSDDPPWAKHYIVRDVERQNSTLEIVDLSGDGLVDVVFCMGKRNTKQESDGVWWLEAPNWTLRRLSSVDEPVRWSLAVASADMDNDGDQDIVALSHDNSNVYIAWNPLYNKGDIRLPWFTERIFLSPGIHRDGEKIELFDMDGDGYRDVLFPRGAPSDVHILLNPKGEEGEEWENMIIGSHGGSDAHDVAVADIDGDGDPDVISATGDGTNRGNVYWFENPGGIVDGVQWHRRKVTRRHANYGGLIVEDIDGDGENDILVSEAHGAPGKMIWFRNSGGGEPRWQGYEIGTQWSPHEVLALDVDLDGTNEYWVPDTVCCGDPRGGIVYFKKRDISLNEWQEVRVVSPPESSRTSRAADMDGDGDLDVVSAIDREEYSRDIVWWENPFRDNQDPKPSREQ